MIKTVPDGLKVELGGGTNPRGNGYVNVDQLPCADVHCDLAAVGCGESHLPFADDSIEVLYSSHCLEHLPRITGILHEIVRVCRIGAPVEIRLPHWLHDSALADSGSYEFPGHYHSYGVVWWSWITGDDRYWPADKKFRWVRTHYQPEVCMHEALAIFGERLGMSDEQIFRFIPGTAHEVHYHFEVVHK